MPRQSDIKILYPAALIVRHYEYGEEPQAIDNTIYDQLNNSYQPNIE